MTRTEGSLGDHRRAYRFAVYRNEARRRAGRNGEIERGRRRCLTERGGPGGSRRSEARTQCPSRGGDSLPFGDVPVVDDRERAEDPVHVPRPGHILRIRSHRETPGARELILHVSCGRELHVESVDGPTRIVDDVRSIVLEATGEDLRRFRLQAHGVQVERGGASGKATRPPGGSLAGTAPRRAHTSAPRGPAQT